MMTATEVALKARFRPSINPEERVILEKGGLYISTEIALELRLSDDSKSNMNS